MAEAPLLPAGLGGPVLDGLKRRPAGLPLWPVSGSAPPVQDGLKRRPGSKRGLKRRPGSKRGLTAGLGCG
ncbi:hypothetical protein MTP02_35260 [Streptomyces albus]|nr:hypothetical protein MTP02_35260 [Streptomyces albus]